MIPIGDERLYSECKQLRVQVGLSQKRLYKLSYCRNFHVVCVISFSNCSKNLQIFRSIFFHKGSVPNLFEPTFELSHPTVLLEYWRLEPVPRPIIGFVIKDFSFLHLASTFQKRHRMAWDINYPSRSHRDSLTAAKNEDKLKMRIWLIEGKNGQLKGQSNP